MRARYYVGMTRPEQEPADAPPDLDESRRLIQDYADSVQYEPPLPDGSPLPEDPTPDAEDN
jgi:hypothetical protein